MKLRAYHFEYSLPNLLILPEKLSPFRLAFSRSRSISRLSMISRPSPITSSKSSSFTLCPSVCHFSSSVMMQLSSP
ncbi:hypothetical protein D3C76_1803000 [compost metagenome]